MEIQASWFGAGAPLNCKGATTTIGAGANGVVTVSTDMLGIEANDYTIEVVEGAGLNVPMSATLTGKDIRLILGTDAGGLLDVTKNTAELVAIEIDALAGVSAGHSGSGATAIGAAVAKKNFAGGQYGTDCPDPFVVVRVWDGVLLQWDYYTAIAPNGRYDANWRQFNLVSY